MSNNDKKPAFEAVLSSKQADLVAGTIARRLFESVETFEKRIDEYMRTNIRKIVIAILGFEDDRFDRTLKLGYDGSYTGPVSSYIRERAKAKALEHAPTVFKAIIDDDFKALATRTLKKSVSDRYDDVYKHEFAELIKNEVTLSSLDLDNQARAIIDEGRRMVSGAAKATIDLYIETAKEGSGNENH